MSLPKISFGGLAEAVDAETAARAQVDLVGVIFENLFLGKPLLEPQRDHHLGQLARPALLWVQPRIRAPAAWLSVEAPWSLRPSLHVHVGGFDYAEGVEARVLEEALIFRRGDRVDQHLGDFGETSPGGVSRGSIGKIGDQLRFQLVLAARRCCRARRRSARCCPLANLITAASWSK